VIVNIEDSRGRRLDCDSHLYLTPDRFADAMGPSFAARYARLEQSAFGPRDVVAQSMRTTIDGDNVWRVKGFDTRASYDAESRLATLDLMGIDRQLIFPEGLFASLATSGMPGAAEATRYWNDYVVDWAEPGKGRLRPAGILRTQDIDEAIAEARRTVDRGAYALYLTCGNPPAGVAPSDPAWDPLWATLAEAAVPALLHTGGDAGFIDKAWGRIPGLSTVLEGAPFAMATCFIAPQVFLTSMLLGGVFERHPDLRFGIIELTAQWVGPLAEMLDERVDVYAKKMAKVLSLKPSEYLTRQVRVTPYYWEPVDRYVQRFGLEDIYVFSTDFPHVEGGSDPVRDFDERVSSLGPEVLEKFVCTNGEVLCPAP
jgi:predicted TIM-barrel fold metal-dependent hydrolase